MKITVVALDTRGGVQPYAALSIGLQVAGHLVQVAATTNYTRILTERGLRVARLSGDTESEVRSVAGVAEMNRRQHDRLMRSRTREMAETTARELLAAAQHSDVLVGGVGGSLVGRPVAERLRVPFVTAHLQPLGPPTGAFPGVLVSSPAWLGGPGRRAGHRLTALALRLPFRAGEQRARDVLGLPGEPAPPDQRLPVLYGYSPQVVPKPTEWGPERHVTGYWTLPAAAGWVPPEGLEDFLYAGPPPVCVGFGSMSSSDPAALGELVVTAARRAGVRVVLLTGWGGLDAGHTDDVFVTSEAPHDWLLPQTAAMVHHGGAGTTGAAITAGVPAVVVPFGVDQPFWGSRVAALGVGAAPIPRRKLTADALADALRRVLGDEAMRRRAAELGRKVRAERGVDRAVEQFDALARMLA